MGGRVCEIAMDREDVQQIGSSNQEGAVIMLQSLA